MTGIMHRFERALLATDRVEAEKIFMESKDREAEGAVRYIEKVVVPALQRIGEGWELGRVSLSQVYMSGRICEDLVDSALPAAETVRKSKHRLAVAVLEDHHLLGKRLVYSVLRASGFDLKDYGQVTVDDLVRRVDNDHIQVLLVSTLMLASALRVKDLRAGLDQLHNGAGKNIKLVVGGAPFRLDEQLWQEVGADAAGSNTSEAIGIVTGITGELS